MLISRLSHGFVPLRPYEFWIGTTNNTVSHEFFSHLMEYDLLMVDASSPIFVLKKFKLDYLWPKYNAWRERLTTNFFITDFTDKK